MGIGENQRSDSRDGESGEEKSKRERGGRERRERSSEFEKVLKARGWKLETKRIILLINVFYTYL